MMTCRRASSRPRTPRRVEMDSYWPATVPGRRQNSGPPHPPVRRRGGSVHVSDGVLPLRAGLHLFKADHPRMIDRYVDYFGGCPIVALRRTAAVLPTSSALPSPVPAG